MTGPTQGRYHSARRPSTLPFTNDLAKRRRQGEKQRENAGMGGVLILIFDADFHVECFQVLRIVFLLHSFISFME